MIKYVKLCIIGLLLFSSGCGVFNPAHKENGYYTRHFYSCGPEAVETALMRSKLVEGILFKRYISAEEISRKIQDNGNTWRDIATTFHESGAAITCPHEIAEICDDYGYKVTTIKKYNELDPEENVALILLYSNLGNWHWVCFPIDNNIPEYYGESTKIVTIFLLEKKL